MKHVLVFLVALLLVGCSKPGEQFIGKWSNEWTNGKLLVDIQRDGDNFLVRTINRDTGRVIFAEAAKLRDGYLMMDKGLFNKFSYSESENAIVSVDSELPIPSFRKVGVLASAVSASGNGETEMAQVMTAFFEKNNSACDAKTSEWCAQSMEATTTGYIVHGKANVPLTKLAIDEKTIMLPCFMLKKAGAKLPTGMVIEVKDEWGETRGYSGNCPAP